MERPAIGFALLRAISYPRNRHVDSSTKSPWSVVHVSDTILLFALSPMRRLASLFVRYTWGVDRC